MMLSRRLILDSVRRQGQGHVIETACSVTAVACALSRLGTLHQLAFPFLRCADSTAEQPPATLLLCRNCKARSMS